MNMKNILFQLATFSFIISSCIETPNRTDRKSEPLYLRQMVKTSEEKSSTSGSYFLIAGSISSNREIVNEIHVFAKIGNSYRFIKMPMNEIRIRIDSSCRIPYVTLNYYDYEKKSVEELLAHQHYEVIYYEIVCSEEFLPEKLLPINL